MQKENGFLINVGILCRIFYYLERLSVSVYCIIEVKNKILVSRVWQTLFHALNCNFPARNIIIRENSLFKKIFSLKRIFQQQNISFIFRLRASSTLYINIVEKWDSRGLVFTATGNVLRVGQGRIKLAYSSGYNVPNLLLNLQKSSTFRFSLL